MGLLLFIFFVVPYAGLAFWVWRETIGFDGTRSALLGIDPPAKRHSTSSV